MKKTTSLFLLLLLALAAKGQHLEYSIHLNSGFFSFAGDSAVTHSFVVEGSNSNPAYTNNPFGSKGTFSYGIAAQIQRVSSENILRSGNDYRMRSSLTVNYKQWGFLAGYSYGLRNYKSGFIGGTDKAYSRFIRLGISYRL